MSTSDPWKATKSPDSSSSKLNRKGIMIISYRIINIVKMSQLMRKLQSNGIIIKSLFYFLFIFLFFYFALNLCIFKKTLYLSSFFFKRFFMYIKNFDYKNFFFWVIQNPCFFCTLLTIIFERLLFWLLGQLKLSLLESSFSSGSYVWSLIHESKTLFTI